MFAFTLEFYTFSSVIILADPTDMNTEPIVTVASNYELALTGNMGIAITLMQCRGVSHNQV